MNIFDPSNRQSRIISEQERASKVLSAEQQAEKHQQLADYFTMLKNNEILLREYNNSQTELVAKYAAAETYNALHGGAPENVIAERLKICGGCEFRSTTYKGATDPDNFGWCTKCGCGNNPRALLVTKARLAQVSCPLTPPRWEKVEGVGGSVASVVDSVKGVAQSIKHLLTGNKDTPPSVS